MEAGCDRDSQIRQHALRHAHRAASGTAASVRSAEGLVKVQVQDIEAHVARTYLAEQRVHIGAVVVEQAAAFVHQGSYLAYFLLEEAEGVRVGHHNAGDVGTEQGLQVFHVHETVGTGLHHHYLQAAHSCAGRIGAVGAVGDYHLGTGGIAAGHMVLTHEHEAGELAVGACAGQEGEVLEAGDGGEGLVQGIDHFLGSLHCFGGLQRVQAGEERMGSDLFVDLGIVLHGAGAQRIEAGIHTEVHLAQVGIVAHNVHLAHFRKVQRGFPAKSGGQFDCLAAAFGQRIAAAAGPAEFEYEFVVVFHITGPPLSLRGCRVPLCYAFR